MCKPTGKLLTILALLALVAATLVQPAAAIAETMPATGGCDMMTGMGMTCEPTIQSLLDCVNMHQQMGDITSPQVYKALVGQLSVAQQAANSGQNAIAVKQLKAFVATIQTQKGIHVTPSAADCLVMHAQMVIQALGG